MPPKYICWIYLNIDIAIKDLKIVGNSLKTDIFRPNPTAEYQGYQGFSYTGYHELSPLAFIRILTEG